MIRTTKTGKVNHPLLFFFINHLYSSISIRKDEENTAGKNIKQIVPQKRPPSRNHRRPKANNRRQQGNHEESTARNKC